MDLTFFTLSCYDAPMAGKYIQVGDILTCSCTPPLPLAKRTDQRTFQIMKFHKSEKVEIEMTHGSTGTHTISCTKCGYKYTCVGITDIIGFTDKISAA